MTVTPQAKPGAMRIHKAPKYRILALSTAFIVVLVGVAGSGVVKRHHVLPQVHCGVPVRDYQKMPGPLTSQPLYSISATADQIRLPITADLAKAGGVPIERQVPVKIYQFPDAELKRDQCSISQVVVTLREDGVWILSLRADQNPRPAETTAKAAAPKVAKEKRIKQTEHIARNEFLVRMRCLGVVPPEVKGQQPDGKMAVGRPALATLNSPPFWVQNGVPLNFRWTDNNSDVHQYFDLIDAVEVEFSYLTSGAGVAR
jgi:hypothetical protein